MAMNKIDGSQFVQPHQLDKYTRADAHNKAATEQREAASSTGPTDRPQDQAVISDNARKLMELRETMHAGHKALSVSPEVRAERLATVRQRLATGFYNSLDVHHTVAGRVGAIIDKIDSI